MVQTGRERMQGECFVVGTGAPQVFGIYPVSNALLPGKLGFEVFEKGNNGKNIHEKRNAQYIEYFNYTGLRGRRDVYADF